MDSQTDGHRKTHTERQILTDRQGVVQLVDYLIDRQTDR